MQQISSSASQSVNKFFTGTMF